MRVIEQDPNARFEKAMFNLLLSFNFIEHNVGYLIASIPGQGETSEIYTRLAKITFDRKLKWFKKLLHEGELRNHIGEEGASAFEEWHLKAHEARELRNRYVHAVWSFNRMRTGSPVSITSPAWMRGIYGEQIQLALNLDELEAKATMVENIFQEFSKLRNKYKV